MPTVNIAPATRQGMKALVSLYGMSETGKTYSAVKLMAGLQPDPAKRGLLDTEGGERGRAYVDVVPGGFMYGALSAPFTPERYAEALQDFIAAGVTCLTVDSVSHAWFAAGGVLDMVENASERNDLAKWAKPKRRLAKLTNAWLGCGLDLILCSRGKQPLIESMEEGRKSYVPGPVVPVQEKSLRFDMTIMAQMLGDGRFTTEKPCGKCPGALRPIFASGDVMDEAMGQKLRAWLGGQDVTTPAQRALAMAAKEVASGGSDAFRAYWKDRLTATDRTYLKGSLDNLQSIAAAADREREAAAGDGTDTDMADPFASRPALPGGVQRVGAAMQDEAA